MPEVAIKVENLSKRYELGSIGTGSLARDVQRWWAIARGKDDPYEAINQQNKTSKTKEHWALRDVSFEINQGTAVGIIGKNGAGKSTLLKILSRVTSPTSGNIKIRGRIASLLEVGTGFHGDLTGRENIFMNGAIMGMTNVEIRSKLDEIIDFSGVEQYIDTPVKRYSSGMYVRLAFAVAAHLEPDILVVDEVLAVGDAEFQKKCLGKMDDVSKKEGRTVLFVSHNMAMIKSFCSQTILLSHGKLDAMGDTLEIIEKYQNAGDSIKEEYIFKPDGNAFVNVERVVIEDAYGKPNSFLAAGEPYIIKVFIKVDKLVKGLVAGIGFNSMDDLPVRTVWSSPFDAEMGTYEVAFSENVMFFNDCKIKLIIGLSAKEQTLQMIRDRIQLEFGSCENKNIVLKKGTGFILNTMKVNVNRI